MVVTAASVQDRDGAKPVLEVLRHQFSRLRHIWADGASAGALVDWVWSLRLRRKVRWEITKHSDTAKGFEVIPKRWMVERTLGWCNRYRRLRGCLRSWHANQPTAHEVDHGRPAHGFAGLGSVCIIFGQTAGAGPPRTGPLHHPPFRQAVKSLGALRPFDELQTDVPPGA